jgi:outer membrane lipoprotein SlyB
LPNQLKIKTQIKQINKPKNKNKTMETVKATFGKVKSNLIGAAIGGVAGYYAAKKFGKLDNKWALMGVAVVGAVIGANVQAKMAARAGAPSAASVKK